jgi:tetratricopeptide (TPR) repeat protein
MKKVVFASLLVCAAIASGLPFVSAAQTAPAGAPGACTMPDAEYKPYTDAMNQTTPQAKAAAIEAYLTAFPQSCAKQDTLERLMITYSQTGDVAKTLDTADRVLQLDPNNLRALYVEAIFRKQSADTLTDPAAKQAALDAAAAAAQKGLAATKPAAMSDADFKAVLGAATPTFYSAIGTAALNKKDGPTAVDAFKKELASVPVDQTTKPGPILQDTYELALAYMAATPPDYLHCAYYAARFVAYAPEPYKSQVAPAAKYCYKKFHGGDDGYDAVAAAAQANLNPPAGFEASVKPAPTPAEQIHGIITGTPDLATLAISDKEMVFQYGSAEDAGKVWDTIKGKSVQIPSALVIVSTPTQLQVAVSDDAIQSKTADFTFNMKAPEPLPDGATAAQKSAYQKNQDAITEATAVGKTVTVQGTYDSFTPKPIMITMSDGEVVLAKAKPAAHAPAAHHPAAKKK